MGRQPLLDNLGGMLIQHVDHGVAFQIDHDGALVRNAAAPTKIQAQYDSADHLHPGDAGYAAMGNAVELTLFAGR
jgi:hypothetical protein